MILDNMGVVAVSEEDFPDMVMAWLTKYREIVSYKTSVRRMTSARCFAVWALWSSVADELTEYNLPTPSKGIPHPLPEGMDGVRRMIDQAKAPRDRILIALCGMAGTRIGEALAVRPDHFDLRNMSLCIKGKGDKERHVPINDEAWSHMADTVLKYRIEGSNETIVGLHDRFARYTITRLGEKAKISRPVASHDLRATFATELYSRTMNQRLVQEILGHSSMDQTSLYIGHTMANLQEAVSKL